MIIINTGMPKSGTSLVFQYQKHLIKEVFGTDGLKELNRHTYHGFVDDIDAETYNMLLDVTSRYGGIALKVHLRPNRHVIQLIERFNAKVTCCYRDPRDIVLSVLDHGERTRKGQDKSGAFAETKTIEDSIKQVKYGANIYLGWREFGKVLMIKYEDLMLHKFELLQTMVNYFGLEKKKINIKEIYESHEKLQKTAWNFNKGTTYRWKREMDEDTIEKCNRMLADEIIQLGYPFE